MDNTRLPGRMLALAGLGTLGVWPFLVTAWDVPLTIGMGVWIAVFFLVFWFIVRTRVFPPAMGT